jgi:collagenase-like PrtC family protease
MQQAHLTKYRTQVAQLADLILTGFENTVARSRATSYEATAALRCHQRGGKATLS